MINIQLIYLQSSYWTLFVCLCIINFPVYFQCIDKPYVGPDVSIGLNSHSSDFYQPSGYFLYMSEKVFFCWTAFRCTSYFSNYEICGVAVGVVVVVVFDGDIPE